ncbi:MAG: hypothetical protein ACI823_000312, partial [Chitinophagales bacterium]
RPYFQEKKKTNNSVDLYFNQRLIAQPLDIITETS